MLFTNRLFMVGLLCVGMTVATTAQAGTQLFEGSWTVKAFGNEIVGETGASEFYSAWGIPQGLQCNVLWPRCPFQSTPTTLTMKGANVFHPLGGLDPVDPGAEPAQCQPWANWQGSGASVRPAKGATVFTSNGIAPLPPLYRNPKFFTASTPSALPNTTYCNATSTSMGGFPAQTMSLTGGPGKLMVGKPVAGTWTATTTTVSGNFNFPAAPVNGKAGIRTGQGTRTTTYGTMGIQYNQGSARSGTVGNFQNIYPYVYSYTYATLRNDQGVFGKGQGPGAVTLYYGKGDATITIKQGSAKFGGTMRMLGALTTKVCYFRNGGCSMGVQNWRYEAAGATAFTTMSPTGNGAIQSGYEALYEAVYYHTALMAKSTINVQGERFPWTTGSVTVKATGRGPHKTVHYAQGYDNRTSVSGKGTIQLVTPMLTRWLQPCCNFETGGVGILRIKFIPEPQTWMMLVAGASLLGVGYRMRGR